jgi:hypothetical protein
MQSKSDVFYRFDRDNPAAAPSRRYGLAKACVRNGLRPSFRDDTNTWTVYRYVRMRDAATTGTLRAELRRDYGDLFQAHAIYNGALSHLRQIIEAYILADEPFDLIGKRLGLHSNVIQWFAGAFFDIEHLRTSPVRMMREVVGVAVGESRSDLDAPRLWKLIGYLLKGKALDLFFYVGAGTQADTAEGVTDWATKQAKLVAGVKQFVAAQSLDVRRPEQLRELFQIMVSLNRPDPSTEGTPQTIYEQHVQAMLLDLPFMVGTDAEQMTRGTPLEEFDNGPVELRDDELMRIEAGKKVPEVEATKGMPFPPPRQRHPALDGKSPFFTVSKTAH